MRLLRFSDLKDYDIFAWNIVDFVSRIKIYFFQQSCTEREQTRKRDGVDGRIPL